ncbi:putative glutaredoxin, Thioredoxin-like superfamily [Helianthus debilis subsp. tardiflorus]
MGMAMRMVTEWPVVIFSRSACCICHSIRTLFLELGVNPVVYELDQILKGHEIEQSLLRRGRNPPAVFIGGDAVGLVRLLAFTLSSLYNLCLLMQEPYCRNQLLTSLLLNTTHIQVAT